MSAPDMLDEYDFSKGVRGKYAKRYAEGTNIVILAPDVAEFFPDSESVNTALRATCVGVAPQKRQKGCGLNKLPRRRTIRVDRSGVQVQRDGWRCPVAARSPWSLN